MSLVLSKEHYTVWNCARVKKKFYVKRAYNILMQWPLAQIAAAINCF